MVSAFKEVQVIMEPKSTLLQVIYTKCNKCGTFIKAPLEVRHLVITEGFLEERASKLSPLDKRCLPCGGWGKRVPSRVTGYVQ